MIVLFLLCVMSFFSYGFFQYFSLVFSSLTLIFPGMAFFLSFLFQVFSAAYSIKLCISPYLWNFDIIFKYFSCLTPSFASFASGIPLSHMLELLILSCSLWKLFYFFLVLFYRSSYWVISIYVSSSLLFFWPCHTACGILVPWPGIRSVPPALELLSLNHWSAWEILLFIISFPVSSLLLSPCIEFYISNIVFQFFHFHLVLFF